MWHELKTLALKQVALVQMRTGKADADWVYCDVNRLIVLALLLTITIARHNNKELEEGKPTS